MLNRVRGLWPARSGGTFWTWPATVALAAVGALLSGVASEIMIDVFNDESGFNPAALWGSRLAVAIGLLALFAGIVQAQRWRKRSRGTFYYAELRSAGESRPDFSSHREAAEELALSSRVVSEMMPFGWGAVDAREQVGALARGLAAELNADDESTSFNIACNMIEPAALTLGYCLPVRPATRLLELATGQEQRRFVVPYALPTVSQEELDSGRMAWRVFTPDGADPADNRKNRLTVGDPPGSRADQVQRVLVTVRTRSWEQADFSTGDCFDTKRKLPEADHFDRCVVVALRTAASGGPAVAAATADNNGFELPTANGKAPKDLREWERAFEHVEPEAFAADVLGVVTCLDQVYREYPNAAIHLDLRMESTLAFAIGDAISRVKWVGTQSHGIWTGGLRDFWARTVFLRRVRGSLSGAVWTHPAQPDPAPYFAAWRGADFARDRDRVWRPDREAATVGA